MSYSLATIRRGFRNLFDKRQAALGMSKAGAYYKNGLHALHVSIEALPAGVVSAPFKDDLRVTDDRHDRFGKVIHIVTEVCFVHPDVDPAVVASAQKIRNAFIPSLDELNAPYATEGERAKDRRSLLISLDTELKKFVLPWDNTKTLADVALGFLDEGEKLDAFLDQRADVPKAVRAQAGALRSRAVGLLNRLRRDLVAEVAQDANLPRDLEHSVFGYFDTLHAMEKAGRGHEPVEGEDEAPKAPGDGAKAPPEATKPG